MIFSFVYWQSYRSSESLWSDRSDWTVGGGWLGLQADKVSLRRCNFAASIQRKVKCSIIRTTATTLDFVTYYLMYQLYFKHSNLALNTILRKNKIYWKFIFHIKSIKYFNHAYHSVITLWGKGEWGHRCEMFKKIGKDSWKMVEWTLQFTQNLYNLAVLLDIK